MKIVIDLFLFIFVFCEYVYYSLLDHYQLGEVITEVDDFIFW